VFKTKHKLWSRVQGLYTKNLIPDLDQRFEITAPIALYYESSARKDEVSKSLRKFYFGDRHIDNDTVKSVVDVSFKTFVYSFLFSDVCTCKEIENNL
jgi:hypothetical protein